MKIIDSAPEKSGPAIVKSPHVMILAGEASGDAHAAEVIKELKLLKPDIKISGMGSSEMKTVGADVFFDSASIAVVGIVEILKHWGDIKKAMELVKHKLRSTHPDLLVLVDYPEFNLKMARYAKSIGIKVLFYISPQVWAWRPKRISKIGQSIDHMAVLFKFEEDFYQKAGIHVTFVGHPLVDKVKPGPQVESEKKRLGLAEESRVIGLFPGSRNSEINRHLPLMLETAKEMSKQNPGLNFVLPIATTLDSDTIKTQCSQSGVNIILTTDNIYDVISNCDAIVSCSGTVTLEIALLATPLCIIYKTSWLTYQIMKRLITIDSIGLVNIIYGDKIVAELIQDEATPQNISTELFHILEDEDYRNKIKSGLARVKENLGKGEGSKHMAELVLSFV